MGNEKYTVLINMMDGVESKLDSVAMDVGRAKMLADARGCEEAWILSHIFRELTNTRALIAMLIDEMNNN